MPEFITKSQLFVAVCAVLLSLETFIIAGVAPTTTTLSVIFFATLFIYNASLLNIAFSNNTTAIKKTIKIEGHPLQLGLCLASILLLFAILTQCKIEQVLIFMGTAAFSLFYMMPLSFNGQKIKGLRNYLFLKNITLSIIWAIATVWFVLAEKQGWVWSEEMTFMFLRRFFFIYSLTIIYDIKDLQKDESQGMQTVALKFGIIRTKFWALASVLIFCILVFTDPYFQAPELTPLAKALYWSAVAAALVILGTETKRKLEYYSYIVDGAMALQFLLVFFYSLSR